MDSASELVQLVFKFCEVSKATVDDMGDDGLFPYRSTQGMGRPPLRALHLASWGGGAAPLPGTLDLLEKRWYLSTMLDHRRDA